MLIFDCVEGRHPYPLVVQGSVVFSAGVSYSYLEDQNSLSNTLHLQTSVFLFDLPESGTFMLTSG